MATNKDIIEKLECVETKLMNGELEQIHQTVTEIKEVLLDPEDGIIVRVNKNTFWRKQIDIQDITELKNFKQNVRTMDILLQKYTLKYLPRCFQKYSFLISNNYFVFHRLFFNTSDKLSS